MRVDWRQRKDLEEQREQRVSERKIVEKVGV